MHLNDFILIMCDLFLYAFLHFFNFVEEIVSRRWLPLLSSKTLLLNLCLLYCIFNLL